MLREVYRRVAANRLTWSVEASGASVTAIEEHRLYIMTIDYHLHHVPSQGMIGVIVTQATPP
jgi:hypothetical protein